MNPSEIIEHGGIVQNTDNHHVFVKIFSQSACGECHSKQLCSMLDIKEKIIEIDTFDANSYKSGDTVIVSMTQSSGWKAIVLGYVFPFILLMTTLITIVEVTGNELKAGLWALGMLIPYYLILYNFRDQMKRNFDFTVRKPYIYNEN